MKHIVYALVDPRSKEWRYIGKSTSGLTRPQKHWRNSLREQTHKANWVRSLRAVGLRYEIELLEVFDEPSRLYAAEQEWIAAARAAGVPLTNATDGGPGQQGRHFSIETRAKIGRAGTGRSHSTEARARIAATLRGRVRPPEVKAKIAATHVGMKHSPETRAKMSANHTRSTQAGLRVLG